MRADFEKKFGDRSIYGSVQLVNWGMTAAPLPENTYDFILVSRAIHGWARQDGMVERNFAQLARGLKPGGSLAIEAHRANPGPQDPKAANGYLTEAWVIEQAAKAGLKLVGCPRSMRIRRTPRITRSASGPCRRRAARCPMARASPVDPSFDRTKYDAIGESDRMTLRFTKG